MGHVINANKPILIELIFVKNVLCEFTSSACPLYPKVRPFTLPIFNDLKNPVCGMANSERRGKINIATRLESDRLVITVHEAAQLSPMDVNGLR